MGIEPTFSAWEADVLPLNYTRLELIMSVFAERKLDCRPSLILDIFATGDSGRSFDLLLSSNYPKSLG